MNYLKINLLLLLLSPIFGFSQTNQMTKDFANLGKYEAENKEIASTSSGNIVFMGDSITEFWKKSDSNFFDENQFINRGISGQTTSQMVLRFQQDVINLNPSMVVIIAGINDIAQNNGPISLEDIMKNISLMTEMAQKNSIKVTLCSVLPANKFNWRPTIFPAEKVIELNKMIKKYAQEKELSYINFYEIMVDENKGLNSKYGKDGVHPNLAGYKIMEAILLDGMKRYTK